MPLVQANARRDVPGFNLLVYLARAEIQVIPHDLGALIEWDTVFYDPRGSWNSNDPTRMTIKATGWYNISFNVGIFCDTKTDRNAEIRTGATSIFNGTIVSSIARLGALTGGAFGGDRVLLSGESGPIFLNAGEWVSLYVTQHSVIDQDACGPTLGGQFFLEAF